MASISLQTLNYSLAATTRNLLSTKADKPVANNAWIKCDKNGPLSRRFQNNKVLRTIHCRVASVDVPKLDEQDESIAEGRQLITDPETSIDYIKTLLRTTGDGRISVSPYDTAWVALIKSLDGRDLPEFPSALKWIAQNQLSDGSWGDEYFFCAYDRLVNTLACVVALRSWNIHHQKCEKGIRYIRENVDSLKEANVEHMTCGFEVVFPALLQRAQSMGIQGLPYEAPVIKEIHEAREQKMKKIPLELMHKVSTSLLFSLEGLENLDWEKLLKLQSADGSFLTSPSSTAFAFMQTKDEKCLEFIRNTVRSCNGGAPHTYPVDVFGRLWAVDRLQRLGISRFFEDEIAELLRHIYSCWSNKGVFSGRDSEFVDIDDTSMGFRLLRQQGYDVDPVVFMNFKNGDKFSCYGGQIIESSSPIYNLYRACQVAFPGETLLDEAKSFAYNFLQEQLSNGDLLDKWVISERLPDEIRLGLEMPWYATLPRVLSRFYLEHYAGADDVWIGKTLYRMPEISNNVYRQLAKSDFKKCQAQHQMEWLYMQEWYDNCNGEEFGVTRKDLLRDYFLAASTIFEQERSKERIAWAKSQIITKMIRYFFTKESTDLKQKNAFLEEIRNINGHQRLNGENSNILVATLCQFLSGFDKFVSKQLKQTWGEWLVKLQQSDQAESSDDAELLATTLNICAGHIVYNDEDILSHTDYRSLSQLANKICHRLSRIENIKEREVGESSLMAESVQEDMKALAKLVLEERSGGGIAKNVRQTFLAVVKTFYYKAYFAPQTMDMHMFKVLFEPVV